MIIRGRTLKYEEDDISTDVIWPGKYTYVQMQPERMIEHAMETFDPAFRTKVKQFQILVVGRNFGCGSSREQACECLKRAGIKAIIAKSFARIFYRNSVNLGLPVTESAAAFAALHTGDKVEIDLSAGRIVTDRDSFSIARYPDEIMELIRHDGLINYIRHQARAGKIP